MFQRIAILRSHEKPEATWLREPMVLQMPRESFEAVLAYILTLEVSQCPSWNEFLGLCLILLLLRRPNWTMEHKVVQRKTVNR